MDDGSQVFPTGAPAALLVIEFPSFRDFIDAYSPLISEEGIFIRNADVSESNAFAVGDQVEFEVRLKDDFRLIQGAGEVAWLGDAEAADGASGTAIRFHDVDEPSQRLISRLVGNYVRGGGTLFEVGGATAEEEALPEEVAEPEIPSEEATTPELELSSDASELVSPPPLDSSLDNTLDSPRLDAESLKASEADALFSHDDEPEQAAPLEFESVSLDEVSPLDPPIDPPADVPADLPAALSTDAADSLEPEANEERAISLDDPVGLETIAIPSGLVASLASDDKGEPTASDEAPESDGAQIDEDSSEESAASASPSAPEVDAPPVEMPAVEDSVPGSSAVLSAAPDLPKPEETPLDDGFDDASLEAAADSMESSLGGPTGIPDDIAQVAEELSGVHRVEMPDSSEASGVDYAGSASVQSERGSGGRIAALSVAFVLLGAAAFYFGDSILAFLGLGGDDGSAPVEMVRTGEMMPVPSAELADEAQAGDEASGADDATAATEAGEVPTSDAEAPGEAMDEPAASSSGSDPEPTTARKPAAQAPPVVAVKAEPAAPAATRGAVAPSRIDQISWSEEGGSTVVTIRLNAEISGASVDVVRVRDGAPREVIKIKGVEVPYSPSEMAVGSSHVLRLRTGLHRANGGSALHVVADLAKAGVTILSVATDGRELRVTFS